jgi:hypothetical protein
VAGYTHCGQVRIPWLCKRVIPCRYPFGIGLPMRFLSPPVIDILDIP